MLKVTLIGDKAAYTMEGLIHKRFDYVETTIFSTIPDFCETSEMRSMTVDRLFIIQDAFNGKPDTDLLASFNDFLGKFYPSVRVISLLNDEESLELFSSIFISPYMVHIKAVNMKSRTVDALIEQKPEMLRKEYGYQPKFTTDDTLDEIIDDTVEEEPANKGKGKNKDKDKKSKGIFSIFGKGKKDKNPKKGKKGSKPDEGPPLMGDIPVYQPDLAPLEEGNNTSFGVSESHVDVNPENDIDFVHASDSDDLADMDSWVHEDNEEQEPEFDFTMFDGQVNVGHNEPEPQPQPELEEEEEEFILEDDNDGFFEEVVLIDLDEDDDDSAFEPIELIEEPDEIESFPQAPLEEEITVDFDEEPEEPFFFEIGLDLDDNGVDEVLEEQPPIIVPDLNQQREKFDTMKRDALSKEVDTSISSVDVPNLSSNDFAIEDVSGEFPVFSDLEDLEKKYNDNNIKVVEVERVVERVVEKPIHVGNSGASKKVYPTGVRTIIFTGDRKSGVTNTALQTAMFYGKTGRTLFVDFDIKRKGSLLFYGINNIIMEPDNIQNGLLSLKTTSMLKHVVYNYMKGGFDCLISLYGEEYENENLIRTQRILSTQKDYSTVIIDCPLENLHLLEDILLYSEIVICMESDLQSTVNTVMGLAGAYEENSKLAIFLYNNAKYLLTMNPDPNKFRENLDYVSDLFSLDEEETDWSLTPILGTTRDLAKILNRM